MATRNPRTARRKRTTPGDEPRESSPRADSAPLASPRLADGIELIGEFEDSGFKEPPYIARRSDGQIVQLPQMLFKLAEQIDGKRTYSQVAEQFSHEIERRVEASDARMLVEQQLRPLGVAAPADGESVGLGKVDPLLGLKFRAAVVPDHAVRGLTTVFRPLFRAPVMVAAVLGMVGLNGWLFFVHGVSQGLRHALYQPLLMLMLIGGMVLATAWHEIGHATATRYGGAQPGVMGVGIYIVWPAFYTDITDAYRLGKWGRLRADIGGMYFNAVFALCVGGLYALTGFEPLLLLILLQDFAILQQSLPLLRLDGYYILSDLTGVPDIFLRIRAVLASFIPGRPADDRVTELKGWVRLVVSAYVALIVVFFSVTFLALVLNMPRMVATGYDSAALRYQAVAPAFQHGQSLTGVLDVVQLIFLVLPGAGLLYTAVRLLRRTGAGAIRWSAGAPTRQAVLVLTSAAAIALAAFSWWPNGEYRPVQPGERGTLTGIVNEVAALPTGRPSLTVQRQRQLGGAPRLSQVHSQPSTSHRLIAPGQSPTLTTPSGTTAPSGSTGPTQTSTTPGQATTTPAPAATTPTSTTQTTASGTTATGTTTPTP
jgi:putative peptide zinc metalloprotease protein